MARVTRFAIAANDPQRAAHFYERIFSRRVERRSGAASHWLARARQQTGPGVDGAPALRFSAGGRVVDTVSVPRLDEAIALVRGAGGAVASGIQTIPEVGRFVYVVDAEGDLFGLMEESPERAALAARPGPRIV
jgi:predicted enzyme related to lactoylglutathione lyase